MHAWLPRIDRAWLVRSLISILELVRGRFGYMSVAFGQSVFSGSIEIWMIFYCKALRKDIFMKNTFRKNVYADFYGLSDIDSVVTDFDPNTYLNSDYLLHYLKLLWYQSQVDFNLSSWCFSLEDSNLKL